MPRKFNAMRFHKKTLIAYVGANLVLIVLGYLQLNVAEPTLQTDQDWVSYGVTQKAWPVISLFMTGLLVAVAYALRGLWLVGKWCDRQVA